MREWILNDPVVALLIRMLISAAPMFDIACVRVTRVATRVQSAAGVGRRRGR